MQDITPSPRHSWGTQASLSRAMGPYALSSNPPAPRPALFRHGDWLCLCAAHNFG